MFTVQQTLDDVIQEHAEFNLDHVIVLGEYPNGALMVKPSRTTHKDALWLIARAQNNVTHGQFGRDNG